MKPAKPRTIRLKDYTPPPYLVDEVDLFFALHATATRVRARLKLRPNPKAAAPRGSLTLDGAHFQLDSLTVNGERLAPGGYEQGPDTLVLHNPPVGAFELECVTILDPSVNTALQGLYLTKGIYCTQCEAEGFRRITYMLDRPDVLARYTVRIEADVHEAPILLANGNQQERGTLPGGRHYAVWHDPHPKPCYLFALVAGDLGSIASDFTTASGDKVDLRIYVEHGKEPRAAWAMDSLKRAMRWDEVRFGREYDLTQFNIVAVSDFNMGAMENKGLNVFNDRLVLASAQTATDANYEAIESVVAHEYFHNWTGNRITCRDWFQLCLKEGLTVYRDQEFSSDERSRTVQRITDVRQLKATQFPEDAGPLSHPVRPESYIEINNFYTATVYEKGAEVVRMLECILGASAFKAGMDLYFERHDGDAATIEDFIACFEEAANRDLTQFKLWYSQAGTPHLDCQLTYDAKAQALDLTLTQSAAAGKPKRRPVPIPIRLGLLGADGRDLPLVTADDVVIKDGVLLLTTASETVRFNGMARRPVASLLRGFSAPVQMTTNQSDADLAFLTAHDSDLFNRWQAAQTYAMGTLRSLYDALRVGKRSAKGLSFARALQSAIAGRGLDAAYRAELLRLPGVSDLLREAGSDLDPALAFKAHRQFMRRVAGVLGDDLEKLCGAARDKGQFSPDAASAGRRALRNSALTLLAMRGGTADIERLAKHYFTATNMTDQAHALALLSHVTSPMRGKAFDDFLDRWKDDDLVIDIWFATQAQSNLSSCLDNVKELTHHPLFKITTPNKVRALIGTFAAGNPSQFHRADGAGYRFVADHVLEVDRFNPQVASRLVSSFRSWRTLEPGRRAIIASTLEHIAKAPTLSRDVGELVAKMREA